MRKVTSHKIVIFDNHERKGKTFRLNEIVKKSKSDYLVLIDADVLPADKYLINSLVEPFLRSNIVGIVSVERLPIEGKNFFERAINASVEFKLRIFEKWNNGNNLYMCFGACRAFSAEFVKKLKWPPTVSEDVYSYLFCIKSGYRFVYNSKGKIMYKSPHNYSDHEKQSMRFKDGIVKMYEYFDKEFVEKEYKIPTYLVIFSAIEGLITRPLSFSLYLLILTLVKAKTIRRYDPNPQWNISYSSKNLSKKVK